MKFAQVFKSSTCMLLAASFTSFVAAVSFTSLTYRATPHPAPCAVVLDWLHTQHDQTGSPEPPNLGWQGLFCPTQVLEKRSGCRV